MKLAMLSAIRHIRTDKPSDHRIIISAAQIIKSRLRIMIIPAVFQAVVLVQAEPCHRTGRMPCLISPSIIGISHYGCTAVI